MPLNVVPKERLVPLRVCTVPLGHFHYDPRTKSLCANASDLGDVNDWPWWLQRMYMNEVHCGVCIRSSAGVEKRFLLRRVNDFEGMTTGWEFVPEDPEYRKVKRVVIHNC